MERITLQEFKALPHHEQYEIIFTVGDFIVSSVREEKFYALYAVDMFFVEIEYDVPTGSIRKYSAFKSGDLINKYSPIRF